jgi:hypothetical protein
LNVTSYCVSLDGLNMRCIGKSGIKDLILIRLIFASRYYIGGLELGWWCLTPLSTIWRSILLTEKTGVPGENHQVTDKLYHMILYRVQLAWAGFELTTLVVIGTDCIYK